MRIFCLGWYGHGNLGDESFKSSITQLFPEQEFTFGDHIPKHINQDYSELWIGGGSFLDQELKGISEVTIPIGFIGIGIGHTTHPDNEDALKRSRFIIVRDPISLRRCPNAFYAPDIVLSRKDIVPLATRPQAISRNAVILLNDFFSPGWETHEWQSLAFYRFSQEFSKACESLASRGYLLKFLPMCISSRIDDRKIAASIIGRMKVKERAFWHVEKTITESHMLAQIATADLVITQRLHGAIYAILLGRPFIVIRAHDKLRGLLEDCGWPGHLNYYGFTDEEFFKIYKRIAKRSVSREYVEFAQKRWNELAKTLIKSPGKVPHENTQVD